MVSCFLLFYLVLLRHANVAAMFLQPQMCEPEAMLVVSPAGVLHAVNPVTKHTIWTYASGSAMGSKLPRQDPHSHEQIVFSDADGNLYVVEGSRIKRTTINMHNLIANTPRFTADGEMVTILLSNTVFLLNKNTGALIRRFDHSGRMWGKPERDSEEKLPTLFFRRTDYEVIVHDIRTGALLWRVTVADIKTMPLGSPYMEVPISLLSSKGVYMKNLLPNPFPS